MDATLQRRLFLFIVIALAVAMGTVFIPLTVTLYVLTSFSFLLIGFGVYFLFIYILQAKIHLMIRLVLLSVFIGLLIVYIHFWLLIFTGRGAFNAVFLFLSVPLLAGLGIHSLLYYMKRSDMHISFCICYYAIALGIAMGSLFGIIINPIDTYGARGFQPVYSYEAIAWGIIGITISFTVLLFCRIAINRFFRSGKT